VLSARLRELSEIGLLDRTSYDTVPPRVEYSLTADGREFVRRLRPLLEWLREDDRSSG
jgi:DNA-binding HxlR family transcriptional regulator